MNKKSHEKKSAWLKKRPKKNLCKSVKSVGHFPVSGGICNDRTGRICENLWVIATAGNLRINSVASDEKNPMRKNLRHLRNLRDKKNVPRKICVYLWNLWDFFQPQGVSATTGQVASAKSAWLKNRSTQMILPDFILFIWSFHYLIIPLQATLKWYTFKLEYKRKWSSKILSAS